MTAPLEAAFREHWRRVLACLVRCTGDVSLAEDATADAFAEAARRWGADVPENPAAWLVTTARNRAVDVLRREKVGAEKLRLLAAAEVASEGLVDDATIPDVRLELIFLCWPSASTWSSRSST